MKCSLLTLSCYVDDELDSRRRGEMEAHLVGCARCRAGLAHIREEVDRVGALARVRVVDESAHALMVQLGLLEPDDPLPQRSAPTDDDRAAGLPPWLQGQATASLPWTPERPRREAAPPPRPVPPELGVGGVPAAHRRLSALEGVPPVPFDVAVLEAGAIVPMTPRATPPASVEEPPPPPLVEEPPPPPLVEEPPPPPLVEEPSLPADAAPPPPSIEPFGIWAEEPPPELRPAGRLEAPTVDDRAETPPSRLEPETDATPPPDPPGDDDPAHAAPTPPGDTPVAVWTTDPSVAPPPGADYPIDDDDILDEPLPVERFGSAHPARAPRATLVDRLRDRLALRNAMASPVDDTAVDAEVEIVSGAGAPLHPRGRSDLGRRRAEALRPALGHEAVVEERPRREPGVRELLPPPARPSAADPLPQEPARPGDPRARVRAVPPSSVDLRDLGVHPRPRGEAPTMETAEARRGAAAIPVTLPDAVRLTSEPGPAPAERAARRAATPARRLGRRTAVAYGVGALVVAAIGIVSARVTSPLSVPPAATSPTQGIPSAPAANGDASGSPSGSSSASSSSAPATAPEGAPATAQSAPSGPSSAGTGGSGWSVQSIRVGDHGTYYRFVFDLGPATPAATGEPKVALTHADATTLVLTMTGATASGSAPTIGRSALVTGIAAAPASAPGTAVYRITLARAGTGKLLYLSSPLRLVVDVTAG